MRDFYPLFRNFLFKFSPEKAHAMGLGGLNLIHKFGLLKPWAAQSAGETTDAMGLNFPNPVGVAAGLDKDGTALAALFALGFGFVEVGTVTPKAQPGNPAPRLFRIPESRALLNRMGFNNAGVHALVTRIEKLRRLDQCGILGVNIGRNKATPNESAIQDYLYGLDAVYAVADYVCINISSPNTPGLRDLQRADQLLKLLGPLKDRQQQLASQHGRRVPLALKVAPDLEVADIQAICRVVTELELEAVIATNTTRNRTGVEDSSLATEEGGLSGAPLKSLADRVLQTFRHELTDHTCLIGVGGICDGTDAARKLELGADLVQLFSGFIYGGPALLQNCVRHCHDPKQRTTA